MKSRNQLSIDEFARAPHRTRNMDSPGVEPFDNAHPDNVPQQVRPALRRVSREHAKGESYAVNVNLDRQTKRRLKLASFNRETSMQAIIEAAIIRYLDEIDA